MSFKSKILIFISAMLLVLLIGTFSLNMSNTQAFLEKQLESHSNDTATSLGLSLSSVADLENPASIEAMINAVFDRGHFARIEFFDMDGNSVYQRINNELNADIPNWFINNLHIEIPFSRAVVQSGWMPIGNIEVQANKGYAYIELWQTFMEITQWFVISALVFLLAAYVAVRILLNPLKKVEQQAQAIVNKHYLVQKEIPSTTEFQNLVVAMNDMVVKLEKVFQREAQVAEKLKMMAYHDSVTELYNRHYFDMVFKQLTDENETTSQGSMCLLKVNGLKEFNDLYGYQLGNDLIKHLAKHFTQTLTTTDGIHVRLNGIEFLAVMPNQSPEQLEPLAHTLLQIGQQVAKELNVENCPATLSIVVLPFSGGQSKSDLFSQMDRLIKQADETQPCLMIDNQQKSEISADNAFKASLENAIAQQQFQLFKQSAYDVDGQLFDHELLIRMIDDKGNLQSAAYFMPAVEQFKLQIPIDKLVLQLALKHLNNRPVETEYSINLSRLLIEQPQLLNELLPALEQAKGKRLAFEFAESSVSKNLNNTAQIFAKLKSLGFKVGIDRFGMSADDMSHLKSLHPDYIKLDGAFSEDIESNVQTQSYVSSLCEMASSLDITVIAMSIENEVDQIAFKKCGVHYFQGYYFGTPMPL